jgi:WD40 repeat protein
VAFSPDGAYLAYGSKDWTVGLLRLKDGHLIGPQKGHLDWVEAAVFSPDGKTLFTGSDDCTIKIWNVGDTLTLQETLGGTEDNSLGQISRINLSPDGNLLVLNNSSQITLYSLATKKIQETKQSGEDAAVSPDGQMLAVVDGGSTIILDLSTLTPLHNWSVGGTRIVYSPNGSLLAVGTWDGNILLVDAHTGQVLCNLAGHRGVINDLKFSPDGQWLASASDDGTVRVWGVR